MNLLAAHIVRDINCFLIVNIITTITIAMKVAEESADINDIAT